MLRKLSFFRKSSEDRELDCFMKSYANLFLDENQAKRDTCQLGSQHCRLVLLKICANLDTPEVMFDSSADLKASREPNHSDTIHMYKTKAIAELVFGHIKLQNSKALSSCTKVHTFPNSENVMFSLICRMRPTNQSRSSGGGRGSRDITNCFCHRNSSGNGAVCGGGSRTSSSASSSCQLLLSPSCASSSSMTIHSPTVLNSSTTPGFMMIPPSQPPHNNLMKAGGVGGHWVGSPPPAGQQQQHSNYSPGGSYAGGSYMCSQDPYANHMAIAAMFSHSPGNRARRERSLTSALILRPSTATSGCEMNQTELSGQHGGASYLSGSTVHREYMAVCILCSPPDCFQDLSVFPLCQRTHWIYQELLTHKSAIHKRWNTLLGSPFLRYLFQHIVIVESLLHYVTHWMHYIIMHKTSSSTTISPASSASSRVDNLSVSHPSAMGSTTTITTAFHHPISSSNHHHHNNNSHITSFSQLFLQVQQRLSDILFAPRLRNPIWLTLTANDKQKTDGSGVSARQIESTRLFVRECFLKMIQRFDENGKNGRKGFLCRFLTAVLTHHPYWVSTVVPAGGKLTKKHLSKHRATWVESLMQCNPYSAEWAQLNDLFSSVADIALTNDRTQSDSATRTFTRTVIVGKNSRVVSCLLYLMSYFIRCSNTNVTEERVPEFCRGDILDMREKRRKRSTSSQGTTGCPSPVAGDSGVSSSQEDIYNGCSVYYSSWSTPGYVMPSSSLPGNSGDGSNHNIHHLSGRVSRSGSSCALNKFVHLTEEKKQIAKALAVNYPQSSNLHHRTLVKFMNENYMEVPLLIENTKLTSLELWDKLCPELLSSSHSHADPTQIEDTHITLGNCLPLSTSLGHSMYGGCTAKYVEGSNFVLQGTTEPFHQWESKIKNDIEMAVLHHCALDEPVGQAVVIIADCDVGSVKALSYTKSHGHVESHCTGSSLVFRLLESVRLLGEAGLPTDILLKQVESGLGDLYYRSQCVANVLFTGATPLDQIVQEKVIFQMLGLEAEDVPLLRSIAHLIHPTHAAF